MAADVGETLRFWLDRGVGGLRVDVADGLFTGRRTARQPGRVPAEVVRCVVNMGAGTVLVGCPGTVLIAPTVHVHSTAGTLAPPPDGAVWLVER